MGYTLDQLLDETGVTKLAGGRTNTKTAGEKFNFSKLAERCRKAADATPEEQTNSDRHNLAEKTAQVEIIRHTMAEIGSILGEPAAHTKTAAARQAPVSTPHGIAVEEFIKAALDQGHSPEAIAGFLQKEGGLLSRIGGRLQEFRGTNAMKRSLKMEQRAADIGGHATRLWEDRLRKASALGDDHRNAVISRMRVALGDENAAKLVHGHPAFKGLEAAKGLKKPVEEAAEGLRDKAIGGNIGGLKAGLSAEQIKKLKTPALALGAGYLGHKALTRSDEGGGKKKGVVIINS